MTIEAKPWRPQDLLDDLQELIDEEPDRYQNTRRTTLRMALDYLKEYFAQREDGWISAEHQLPEPETGLRSAASHAREVADRKRAEGCLDCAEEHLQLAAWLEELQAYKDTGVSVQELQDVVDLFTEVTVSNVDIPKELKKWMDRCTWHVGKCGELREKLDRTEIELENTRRVLGDRMEELNGAESALEKARETIASMKADLLLTASGHCCGICARKAECADVAQVTCCSAFRYYKTEEG